MTSLRMAITMVLAPTAVTVAAIFLVPSRGTEAQKPVEQMDYVGKCVDFAPYKLAKVFRHVPIGRLGNEDTFHLVVTDAKGNEQALMVPSSAVTSLSASICAGDKAS
ncbi:hypothetical protein G6L37_04965 [Agrobacterium rubi]|nr:hypothetical protein [Agrobacterium rubi]NTF24706.1 hypothetical protein [Agrobacterium rubi]